VRLDILNLSAAGRLRLVIGYDQRQRNSVAVNKISLDFANIRLALSPWTVDTVAEEVGYGPIELLMEVLLLFLCVLLLPVIAVAVLFCMLVVLFLTPVILLTLPVGIPMWILTAFSSEREPGRDA
jgi:hypothetical protein